MKILIADDSATSLAVLRKAVSRWGYDVITAADGAEAWEILERPDAPQLAIIDWVMPHLTGTEICRRVRKDVSKPYTYILLLCSKNTKGEIVEGLESGADDYVVKPFDQHELQVRLRAGVRILDLINNQHSEKPAIEFYSCFISHSSADSALAETLCVDLKRNGVTCWYAPKDLKIGDEFRICVDEAIRMNDKLLVILSRHSIQSEWVKSEVEEALSNEKNRRKAHGAFQGNTHLLFPISIDDGIDGHVDGWARLIKRERHIGDFRGWQMPDRYTAAFDRLLRDLRKSEELDREAETRRRAAAEEALSKWDLNR